MPVFNCPHCGTECQESAVTAIPPALIIICISYAAMKAINYFNINLEQGNNGPVLAVGIFVFLFVFWYLWWKFVSKLKEAHNDFW